jgi:hypothetical protein
MRPDDGCIDHLQVALHTPMPASAAKIESQIPLSAQRRNRRKILPQKTISVAEFLQQTQITLCAKSSLVSSCDS